MDQFTAAWDGVLPPEETSAESREAPRFTLLMRAAKLIVPSGEFLCIVRDVSSTGLSTRNFHALPPGRPIILVLQNGDQHQIEKMWERDGAAGFQFAEPVDIVRFLSEHGRYPKRPVRLSLNIPAQIASYGSSQHALIEDISQQGARIECSSRLAIDQTFRIEAKGLPEIRAKVRWRRDRKYGLVFEDTFQFAELASLAVTVQCPDLAMHVRI
ncbi:PilZ domain-containing protein [Altererythrobacter aquiaggeris]|uniref:PilZ domain-containing protein n=1 Tax=Aestuarierythrobacter aquiaggeris TaxID=1898396 RepID=UPI003017C807